MADPHRMLDAREVQQVLGISSATFYRWLREGRYARRRDAEPDLCSSVCICGFMPFLLLEDKEPQMNTDEHR